MSLIFYSWEKPFLNETRHLRVGGQNILLLIDCHSSHVQFAPLNMLKSHGVLVRCLPAHTSHITQPLDVSVFRSFKENFRKALRERARPVPPEGRNDIFTICELMSEAYFPSLSMSNIIFGFAKSGCWPFKKKGPDSSAMTELPFTSPQEPTREKTQLSRFHFLDLHDSKKKKKASF